MDKFAVTVRLTEKVVCLCETLEEAQEYCETFLRWGTVLGNVRIDRWHIESETVVPYKTPSEHNYERSTNTTN